MLCKVNKHDMYIILLRHIYIYSVELERLKLNGYIIYWCLPTIQILIHSKSVKVEISNTT